MLTLNGKMNEHLNYIYLFSDEGLVPTTIYFFNNNTWSEAAPGKIAGAEDGSIAWSLACIPFFWQCLGHQVYE